MPQIRQKLCQINQTDIFSVLMDSVFTKKKSRFYSGYFLYIILFVYSGCGAVSTGAGASAGAGVPAGGATV